MSDNEKHSSSTAAAAPPAPPASPTRSGWSPARRRWLQLLAGAVGIALLAYVAYWYLGGAREATDDAYVAGDQVMITARDPGTVIALHADDTEQVRAGQPLVDLDPATADVELAAAAARLGQAVRAVRASYAEVAAADAAVVEARTALARARADLARRQPVAAAGAVSGEELAHAEQAVAAASAALGQAEGRLALARAEVQGAELRSNPAVLAAVADYRRAAIRRGHMHIVAPVDGTVARRSVQIGQQVAAGTSLMVVVPLQRLWVDANFRETQLADLRLGQPVTISTDIYGSDVEFHGQVLGLAAGSGNAFALLPPQNATGNWIKIVQRVPVRIALDPRELEAHPLRIGLSVTVEVDTSERGGSALGREARSPYAALPESGPEVETAIERIIAANAGQPR